MGQGDLFAFLDDLCAVCALDQTRPTYNILEQDADGRHWKDPSLEPGVDVPARHLGDEVITILGTPVGSHAFVERIATECL